LRPTTDTAHTNPDVSGAGDVNGDGFKDVIVSNLRDEPLPGVAYVVFGGTHARRGGVDLDALDGTDGFVISGTAEDDAGNVSSAGDFNGDGFGDLLISSNNDLAFLVFGGATVGSSGELDLGDLDGSNGFVISDGTEGVGSVAGVGTSAGDFNADGYADIALTAGSGRVPVVFGGVGVGAGGTFDVAMLDGENGFVASDGGYAGLAAGVGDVNGDGLDDLLVGAPGTEVNGMFATGRAYVVFGRNSDAGSGRIVAAGERAPAAAAGDGR
jgi:hypothetical protein